MRAAVASAAARGDARLAALLIGAYAQAHAWATPRPHAATRCRVARFLAGLPLPHPSPRNRLWFKRHPWFERRLPVARTGWSALPTGDNGGAHNPFFQDGNVKLVTSLTSPYGRKVRVVPEKKFLQLGRESCCPTAR
jgi:hypothetical protein